jgi:hypothetical protein
MADPVTALMVLAAAGTVGESYMDIKGEQAGEQALDLKEKADKLRFTQKTLSNYDVMQKVLDRETASASVRGVALSSPSITAEATDVFNLGAKEQTNIDIERAIARENISLERRNIQNSLFSKLFSNATSLATSLASAKAGMPTKTGGAFAGAKAGGVAG